VIYLIVNREWTIVNLTHCAIKRLHCDIPYVLVSVKVQTANDTLIAPSWKSASTELQQFSSLQLLTSKELCGDIDSYLNYRLPVYPNIVVTKAHPRSKPEHQRSGNHFRHWTFENPWAVRWLQPIIKLSAAFLSKHDCDNITAMSQISGSTEREQFDALHYESSMGWAVTITLNWTIGLPSRQNWLWQHRY